MSDPPESPSLKMLTQTFPFFEKIINSSREGLQLETLEMPPAIRSRHLSSTSTEYESEPTEKVDQTGNLTLKVPATRVNMQRNLNPNSLGGKFSLNKRMSKSSQSLNYHAKSLKIQQAKNNTPHPITRADTFDEAKHEKLKVNSSNTLNLHDKLEKSLKMSPYHNKKLMLKDSMDPKIRPTISDYIRNKEEVVEKLQLKLQKENTLRKQKQHRSHARQHRAHASTCRASHAVPDTQKTYKSSEPIKLCHFSKTCSATRFLRKSNEESSTIMIMHNMPPKKNPGEAKITEQTKQDVMNMLGNATAFVVKNSHTYSSQENQLDHSGVSTLIGISSIQVGQGYFPDTFTEKSDSQDMLEPDQVNLTKLKDPPLRNF